MISKLRTHWALLASLLLTANFLVTGFIGLDFGAHPDEWEHYNHMLDSAWSGTLLPGGYYVYPSLIHWVSLAAVGGWKIFTGGLITDISMDQFLIPARAIALAITSAGGMGLYFAGRRWAGAWAGFTAAAIYLTSWQIAFHGRWLAPDAMLASVTGLFLCALIYRWTYPDSKKWAFAAAALAGVATSTKYQGGVLLFGVLGATLALNGGFQHWRRLLRSWLRDLGVFVLAFIVVTPGALLEPSHFIRALLWNKNHYAEGHIYFYNLQIETIRSPLQYVTAQVQYLVTTLPSPSLFVSVGVVLLALLGAVLAWRSNWKLLLCLVIPPLVLLGYFATVIVFFPRNFLLVLPVMAFLAGFAVQWLATRPSLALSFGIRIVVAVVTVVAAVGLWSAARSVAERGPDQRAHALANYAGANPDACLNLGPTVRAELSEYEIVPVEGGTRQIVLSTQDVWDLPDNTQLREWPSYKPGYFTWLGSAEVDFNYYAQWPGESRYLVFSAEDAERVGLTDEVLAGISLDTQCVTVRTRDQG